MNMNVWSSSIAAMALVTGAAVAAAQEPTSGSAASTQHSDKNMITVSGCLQEVGGAGSSTSASKQFVLTNATMSSSSASPSASTTPSTPPSTSSAAATGTTYQLDGSSSELRPHVNHQVQITGRLDNKGSGSPSSSSSSSSTSTSGPKINVESVRMVASTCSSR